MRLTTCTSLLTILAGPALAKLNSHEATHRITFGNSRLNVSLDKTTGLIDILTLDNQNLLGTKNGSTGVGPYLDCYCTPSGAYTPFRSQNNTHYTLLSGIDTTNTPWIGVIQFEIYAPTNQTFQQYFFLRGEETGLHTFTRLTYHNLTTPFLRNLQELRTLFRHNTKLWSHLSTTADVYSPLPNYNPAAPALNTTAPHGQAMVQDATWLIPNASDPYVESTSSYYTKYTFSDSWRHHTVHGLTSTPSAASDTFGAWFVMANKDTYFGGPTHSDLTVDGYVYDYIVSNHHGDQTPNITNGFERTFGPGFYYFNHGSNGESLQQLRSDAEKVYANAGKWSDFYDSIAPHVEGYIPSSGRGTWSGHLTLPKKAQNAVAILSAAGIEIQDNVFDTTAHQYWADINQDGSVTIDRVKSGTYRLTIYGSGIFGQFIHDNIIVKAGHTTKTSAIWQSESAGTELWRIGTPDWSSGEYLHGEHPDPTHPQHLAERRIYFAVYDFVKDFPHGVSFHVGNDSIAKDLNYVHWSVFGGYGNSIRTEPYHENGIVNNWKILFDASSQDLSDKTTATFTIQLAAARTAAGNTDIFNSSQRYSNLPYTVSVNGHHLEPWIIPSCAVRSAVSCYHLSHKFVFHVSKLRVGRNEFLLSLPRNATGDDSALLAESVYVQYDALRLEVK
ncbi:polysaccharide lyase family 4 protein [Pseudocercospora fijiensis CIRAD86]|uniref:rhamnogalacturonan endolyase n=1 Tax=Pseudocercospora fijiensis (strain CIRAD86) TaxID=383855 RepID=M3AKC4_PSEFD|nr:polysaccharide lyase family 4 protein [Pseudocercospora fijiensis CIRAD86]EME77917.1 polysaccharide lyase family 4 protein [Pseudocercospora fijiensis CIRAD86]